MVEDNRNQETGRTKGSDIEYEGPEGCLLRLFWMAFGNLALLMVAGLILQRKTFSALDAAYWAVVIGLAVARYFDIARFGGQTSQGEPATMRHFRHYVARLLAIAAALWAGIHFVF